MTGTVTPAVLFPAFGSFVPEAEALFRMFVAQKAELFCTCTTMERVTEELALRVPIVHVTCCPVTVQFGAARIVREEGMVSVITAFCAAVVVEGFVRVRLYVKVSPMFTLGMVEVFASERSAVVGQLTGTETEEVLFTVLGSLELVAEAEFTKLAEQRAGLFGTCTVIVRLTGVFALSVPMLQVTCCPVIVQFGAAVIVKLEGTVAVSTAFCEVFDVELFVSVSEE